ncbi:hypothetical protein QBC47DRAFT_387590 [Echria macrotheca]|uniref:Uncharacterized protein n=1 Tax=Echria macrotheca TaxID=438768 RepID=A0AAJ0B886_9PEZI|nr:hypothetical protein QBC47DRAFT_387590 [Echria macrotheca]
MDGLVVVVAGLGGMEDGVGMWPRAGGGWRTGWMWWAGRRSLFGWFAGCAVTAAHRLGRMAAREFEAMVRVTGPCMDKRAHRRCGVGHRPLGRPKKGLLVCYLPAGPRRSRTKSLLCLPSQLGCVSFVCGALGFRLFLWGF